MNRLINKLAVALFRIPWVTELWSQKFHALKFDTTPWTPLVQPLSECKIVLLTTGGAHLRTDLPFNMADKNGDPSYRKIPSTAGQEDIMITHDYYDHRDADQDINLIFPIAAIREHQKNGIIGESADFFYSFMGHTDGPHLDTIVQKTAKEVAQQLRQQKVDIALLVPA